MVNYRHIKPLNMPRSMNFGSNYYIIKSRKTGRIVHAFSLLEYCNILTLELDHGTEYYCEQPLKLSETVNGERVSAVFDMWVQHKDGSEEYQEIKTEAAMKGDERSIRQIKAESSYCEKHGFGFSEKTEGDLFLFPHYLDNLVYLYGHLSHYKVELIILSGRNCASRCDVAENASIVINNYTILIKFTGCDTRCVKLVYSIAE